MPVDPYSPCPGGTGKKVKFCCPDLLGELDDIQRMLEGDQRLACLEHIDKLEPKFPDRACLMSIKAMLEAQLGREGKAEATLAQLMAKYPDNPVALAEDATLKATKQNGKVAIEPLQRAIAASSGTLMTQVYDAIAVVGERLVMDGDYLAARGHLMLALDLSGGRDERASTLLNNLDASPQLPLLYKESQPVMPAPEGALWKGAFDHAMSHIARAEWLSAANELRDLAAKAGDWPAIWRNLATLRLWLADTAAGLEALRKFARQPIGVPAAPPLDDAVEAEALAQMIDTESADVVDVLTIAYPITNFDRAIAQFSSDPRFAKLPIDLARLGTEDQPPPKAAMWIVDRAAPASGVGITREQVPRIVGQVFVFGKQTDREARLELVTYRTDELSESQRVLTEALRDAIGPPEAEQVTTHTPAISHALSWNWRLPEDTPASERQALIAAERRKVLLETWPAMVLKVLGGVTPQQAAADPAGKVPALAAVLLLELASMNDPSALDFNELRTKLGLPLSEPIQAAGIDVSQLPLARLHRLDPTALSDEQLLMAYARAAHYRQVLAIRRLSEEVLKRPSLEKEVPRQEVYGQLAQLETNPKKAVEYIDLARKAAEAAGQSSAPWDITEMTLRLSLGEYEVADRLLHHIRNEHLREPGVAQMLYQVLTEAGVIRPDGTPAAAPPTQEAPGIVLPGGAAAAAEPGKIWTPGSETAPAAGKKSALWTPD
jgi:hypothetical protein